MKETLKRFKELGYINSYYIEDELGYIVIRYGLSSVEETERVIDIINEDLKQSLLESAKNIRVDIESTLLDDDDFFGYDNAEELEDRIVEETEFLKKLGKLVGKIEEDGKYI